MNLEETASSTKEGARHLLARTSLFAELTTEQLAAVAALVRRVDYERDDPIYDLGDPADDLFILERGTVRFNLAWRERKPSGGYILRSGEVFGWAALLDPPQRRICTAHCIGSASVVAISGPQLCALMDQDHSLGYSVMHRLSALITGNLTTFAAG